MANQKQYFEAKEVIFSTVMKVAKEQELDVLQLISLLSSITSEVADVQHKSEEEKKQELTFDNLIGKRVQVNAGNDKWGEIIIPGVPHLVTCEVDGWYGVCHISDVFTDEELVAKRYHKFIVSKKDVELWKTPYERFMNPERIGMPDIDIDVK